MRSDTGEKPVTSEFISQFISILRTEEKSYICQLCQESFSKTGHLKVHMRTHTGEKPYKCQLCQKSFSESGYLKKHMKFHSGEQPYKCQLCQKSFIAGSSLKTHMRTHTGEKPYKCQLCHKSFNQFGHLKVHMPTHTGEKPYKCELCQMSFARNSGLKRHTRTHTDEKPYKCQLCQKSFALNNSLKTHMRTHTGEKPYKCPSCQKSFARCSYLKIHMRTHTGEKPYKCQLCQKSFADGSDMKKHMTTHIKGKPCKCQLCYKSFTVFGSSKCITGEKTSICRASDKGFTNLETLIRCRRSHMDEEQHTCSNAIYKGSSSTSQLNLHAGIESQDIEMKSESSADLSVPFFSLSNACIVDKPVEIVSKDNHADFNEKTSSLAKIKSFKDAKPFVEKFFGCGICGEMLEIEKEFLEHCSCHRFSPPDDLFINIFC